jgi:hypothetical protein
LLGVAWRRGTLPTAAPWRTGARALVAPVELSGAARVLWWLLIAWFVVRFALLGVEVASRPLYPWDAWLQWATKARVWYELGQMTPFARAAEWMAGNGSVYFDASPEYPPTMPLLQVWSCIAMGRWDDVLMNWPWWQIAVALSLAMYGGLRALGASPLAAIVGAFLVASLPLANVHVALAGYADLPLAAYYTTAVLAFLRWNRIRDWPDAVLVIWLLVAATQVKNPGIAWAATLLPALAVALSPRHGKRVAAILFGVAIVGLLVLARVDFTLFNYRLHLEFDPAWSALGASFFLLGNWHLLWYGAIAAALLAWRQLLSPSLAPLTVIVAAGVLFLFVVFGFTNARAWVADQTSINRATLHLAPVIVLFMVLAWQAFAAAWRARFGGAVAIA